MTLVKVRCGSCGKKFLRGLRRFNEAKKFGWKHYCSSKCQSQAKSEQQTLKCGNSACNKTFKRKPSDIPISGICFCSKSCSAIVNNSKSPKRQTKIRICPACGKKFTGRRKYCSSKCWPKPQRIAKEQIINEIKEFYKSNGRIPLKREYFHYSASRLRFGTWNKAIKVAGFKPNPVMFAKKYIANDGHRCDSLAEKIIDDWLTARKIKHKVNVPYPENKSLTADFVVSGKWIEFFGLDGELRSYDQLKKRKLKLARKHSLHLIPIYPKDLFPKCQLDQVLNSLVK